MFERRAADGADQTGASDRHAAAPAAAGIAPTPVSSGLLTLEQIIHRRKQLLAHHPVQHGQAVAAATVAYRSSFLCVASPRDELLSECVEPSAIAAATLRQHLHPTMHWTTQQPFLLPPVHAPPMVQEMQPLAAARLQWQHRWKEMIHTQLPKHHAYQSMRSNLQHQQRTKLCTTISKEYVRLLHRQFRCARDAQVRGRRLVREVAAYWRRAEKESWENRKRAEREEIENRKKMTELKESDRQKKKLEFLLTQTELYSHFLGKKMGVIEETTPSAAALAAGAATPAAASATMSDVAPAASTPGDAIPASLLQHAATVRNEANISADEAARSYIASQRAKMAEFDQLESRAAAAASGQTADADADSTSPSASPQPATATPDDSLDLLNPSTMPQQDSFVSAANSFKGTLKSYQLRGLNWLLNLYEQGINGILADEMGLGKTVQSISFLSYLAGSKDIWGPFLIVAPNSTLHQWQQEVTKFCPDLKVLPYWGSAKERQILRQFWTSKQMYTKQAPFHVLITSYNVVVADEKYFHRMRFMYMVLDEAQAIKNAASQRWKCLLNLKCRNRVLLTGTPIQNSMAELWALLHFIMPELFSSHEDFHEWFSKDVEGAVTEGGNMDQRQVARLHMIIKPFMLRRVKKDVENEMPPKIEVTLPCKLSAAQSRIYKTLQKKVFFATEQANPGSTAAGKKTFLSSFSGPATFTASDPTAADSLVTLVMQFRKHPELYEHKHVLSPYYFGHAISYPATKQKTGGNAPTASAADDTSGHAVASSSLAVAPSASHSLLLLRCPASTLTANPIAPRWPSLLHQAIRVPSREKLLNHTFNIFTAHHTVDQLHHSQRVAPFSAFSFLPFLDLTPTELEFSFGAEPLHAWFMLLVLHHRRSLAALRESTSRVQLRMPLTQLELMTSSLQLADMQSPSFSSSSDSGAPPSKQPLAFSQRLCLVGDGLVWRDPSAIDQCMSLLRRVRQSSRPRVLAAPAYPLWSHSLGSPSVHVDAFAAEYVGWEKSVLLGCEAWKWAHFQLTRNKHGCAYPVSLQQSFDLLPTGLASLHRRTYTASPYTEQQVAAQLVANRPATATTPATLPTLYTDPSAPLHQQARVLHASSVVSSRPIPGLLSSVSRLGLPAARMNVPTVEDLITDSGKLQVLDELLARLKKEGRRCLIFSQMTKLIDLLENFLNYRRYKFSRLDGQTSLSARRDLVRNFQNDPSVFAFLLSTRAGGLGITLTAADTVIFYDNDWNPSSDAQAMDRVHRIGQTKQVHVYRLVCVNTVEERILIRAQQKHVIQNTVYAGGFKMAAHDSKAELQELFSGSELQQLLEVEPGAPVTTAAAASSAEPPMTLAAATAAAAEAQKGTTKHPLDAGPSDLEARKRQKVAE